MIITISGADFSLSNIGTLSTWTVSKSIGAGAEHNIPSYVDKNSAFNYEITLKDGYTFGTYSVKMGGQIITPTVTETSMTINIPSVTGAIRIEVKTINSSTGEPEEPEEPSTGGDISGWTEIPLNTDASSWIRATVSATGVGTEGSSDKRLTYNKVLDIPTSQRIKVVCNSNYQWGVRNGASESTLGNNQFWLNSGDEVQFAHTPTDGKFMLVFRKNTAYRDPFSQSSDPTAGAQTITKSDVATMQPKLYYKDEYSAEFDVTNYKHVMDLTTSQSDWIRATVSDNGPGEANSSTTRLTYNKKLDASLLQEKDVILITCAAGYQWGVRSSNNGTTFKNNSYWFNSGTCVRFSMSGTSPITNGTATNFYIVFRKAKAYNGAAGSANDDTITFNDINTLNAKVYTAKPY